jgi:Fic family protein
MKWNWQQEDWPNFRYDVPQLEGRESLFLKEGGTVLGSLKHLGHQDKETLTIDLMSVEALKTSEIEGEHLNRESVQSSIRQQFGLHPSKKKVALAEQGIAEMLVDLYRSFSEPLTHATLFSWHRMVMKGRHDLMDVGGYRTHEDPMQVVSGADYNPKVHFEAPPSSRVKAEMDRFCTWFNRTSPTGETPLPALTRGGIAHLYFICIHPFEDGNGRIGRAIAEKALSQSFGAPTLIALSYVIEKNKKSYYSALEEANKSNEITPWLIYFEKTILEAQRSTGQHIEFLIKKTKLYDRLRGELNERQERVLARVFREGPDGFKGGLSAENYLKITGTSRATATRDLQDLVEKGAFVKTGEKKSTRYTLNLGDLS